MQFRKLLAVASFATVGILAPQSALASAPLPSSIAGIGDSITRAADVCCWYGDHPSYSWSTGGGAYDGITSHYEHILALKSSIYGHNYNDAKSGAKMRDAQGQALAAVSQRARYVTILMGPNDACTSSTAAMTSVSDFQTQFQAAMSTLASGLPHGAHVFVASIPNIYHLWELFHDDWTAELVWSSAGICQSMLSLSNTESDRKAVLDRVQAFNTVLAQVCGQYSFCRFDGNAVFNYPFTKSQVSKLDYFHPSFSGQAALASITWTRSWWGTQ